MIASLRGKLTHRLSDALIVETNGVGYRVAVSQNTLALLPPNGSDVFLWIITIVREDDLALYGFVEESERNTFQKLISVSGIGPKLALTILSGIKPSELVHAIRREDLARLTLISGVGKKTAERIILELKDKLEELSINIQALTGNEFPKHTSIYEETLSALLNLGYPRAHAEKVLQTLSAPAADETLEGFVKKALMSVAQETSR